MNDALTKRSTRIEKPSINLAFRTETRDIVTLDVYREDVLAWRPDSDMDTQHYLVLDFGTEEHAGVVDGEYTPTGRIVLSLQPVEFDPDTWNLADAVGLGPEVNRFADMPTDLIGDRSDEDPTVGRPLVGWTRHAVSTRRDDG